MALNSGDVLVYDGTKWANQQSLSFSQSAVGGTYFTVTAPLGSTANFITFGQSGSAAVFAVDYTGGMNCSNTCTVTLPAGSGSEGVAINVAGNTGMRIYTIPSVTTTKRVKVDLNNQYQFGIDANQNNTGDLWFFNNNTGHFVLVMDTNDGVNIGRTGGKIAPTASLSISRSSASNPALKPLFQVTGPPSDTGYTASTEANQISFNLSQTYSWLTGNITNQRAIYVQAPTYAFAGASTITSASTLYIDHGPVAGTNAVITNSYALYVGSGITRLGGLVSLDGDGTNIFQLNNLVQTTAAGTYYGKFPVNVPGVGQKWVHLFN